MSDAVELVVRQPGHPDRVVRVPPGVTQVGRGEDSDVVLPDVGVSRRHARIVISEAGVEIEDLGSGNGTWSRGSRIHRQRISDGDEIGIDPFILLFRLRKSAGRDANEYPPARLDVYGANSARTSYPLTSRGLTIGRNELRDVVLADPASSREHCAIVPRDGAWMLRDNNSANGVFVNGNRVREALLADSDQVRIGNTEMRFLLSETTSEHAPPGVDVDNDPWAKTDALDPRKPPPDVRPPSPRSSLAPMLGAGFGLVFLLGMLLLSGVVVAGAGVVVLQRSGAHRDALHRPPAWSLTLRSGLHEDARTAQDHGIAALRERDYGLALEAFRRVLDQEPGKPSAERLAYAAGEYLVLDAVAAELDRRTAEEQARIARRTSLLGDLDRGQRGRALGPLEQEFRDDPVVCARLGWPPSAGAEAGQAAALKAAEAVAQRRYAEAARLYREALAGPLDDSWRATATAGLRGAERGLSLQVAPDWRAGIAAEQAGDVDAARARYEAVLAADPTNPSARIRLARLAKPG
jgi:pSer/pThr/pTyr-binding forkhead associated (FHA) protein